MGDGGEDELGDGEHCSLTGRVSPSFYRSRHVLGKTKMKTLRFISAERENRKTTGGGQEGLSRFLPSRMSLQGAVRPQRVQRP